MLEKRASVVNGVKSREETWGLGKKGSNKNWKGFTLYNLLISKRLGYKNGKLKNKMWVRG